jgi:hypothetical protein
MLRFRLALWLQGAVVLSQQATGPAPIGRVLVARFGLYQRSRGCARLAHDAFLVEPLRRLGYRVDVWDSLMVASHNATIDGVRYVHNSSGTVTNMSCPFDRCFYEPQKAVDDRVEALCARTKCIMTGSEYADPERVKNVCRQFYTEYSLAQHVLASDVKYDLVVAVSEDIAPLYAITASDVANALQPDVVVASNSYDYWGFTNGLYAATPAALFKMMATFANLSTMLPTPHNYEGLLKLHAPAPLGKARRA